MSEVLDLGNLESVAIHRDALITDLPDILRIAGGLDQASLLERGQNDEVVGWLRKVVSVGGHGVNGGSFGLSEDQTREFNPYAQSHGLMGSVRLWKPGDDLPEGAQYGGIAEYSIVPDLNLLPESVFKAEEVIAVDATVDGTIGRVQTALEVAAHVQQKPGDPMPRVVVLTGMRAVKPAEGSTGLYKQFLPEAMAQDTPIETAFPSAADATIAILNTLCSKFEQIAIVDDPEAGKKAPEFIHPKLGGREWILHRYIGEYGEGRRPLSITVVNGQPIWPTGNELNRSTQEPAPTAAATLADYLRYIPESQLKISRNLAISYAHLARIGSQLVKSTRAFGPDAFGTISLVGSMPQPETWNKMNGQFHNGGTLGFKEVLPLINAYGGLLGLPEDTIGKS
jgi:hypothetical protein